MTTKERSFKNNKKIIIWLSWQFKKKNCVRLLSVLRFFIPATTANDLLLRRIIYPRFYPLHLFSLHLFSYLNSWERASIFPFECSVLNKGITGTIFIRFLVWLVIEPGMSLTRSQHYTTRLSRRRYDKFKCFTENLKPISMVAIITAFYTYNATNER